MSDKDDLIKYVEEKIESIKKEVEVKDSIIEDLRQKNVWLAQQLIAALEMGKPLPETEAYVGVL
jgi:chaperonin cofactor prefoldin